MRTPLTPDIIAKNIRGKSAQWQDRMMKRIVPQRIYNLAHSEVVADREQATNWLKEKGYRFEQKGDQMLLKRGETILARCTMILELQSPEEMIAMGKLVRAGTLKLQ